jgi:hypothetical protein
MLAEQSSNHSAGDKLLSPNAYLSKSHESANPPWVGESIPSVTPASLYEQLRIYKEEQLLSHPGGDYFDPAAKEPKIKPEIPGSYLGGIVKDIKDGIANAGNFFKDLLFGSEYRFLSPDGTYKTAQRTGLLGNIVSFFKHAASALTLGQYCPENPPEPDGIIDRAISSFKKLFSEGIMNHIISGIPSSAINLLDDTALSIWNLIEVVPDATLGTLPEGRKVVSTLFDNGQVAIDYITDCLPTGEAWMRVHGYQGANGEIMPPVLLNLKLPEYYQQDARWNTVRNTPLRKTMETIGSILADIGAAIPTYYTIRTSNRRD